MKIMIVDDNPQMRRLIRTMLGGLGHESCEVANGQEAVDTYAVEHPDVVLMDIRMPVMNGIDATKQILASHPEALVVIVTEYDTTVYRMAAQRAGAKDYVLKENLQELRPKLISLMHLN